MNSGVAVGPIAVAGISQKEDRLSRILRLGAMLRQNSGSLRAEVICDKLNISRRTFYRDIRLLRNAGAQVRYRPDTGAYEAELFSSIIGESLSPSEAAAVIAALAGSRPRRSSEFESSLTSARKKLAEIIGEHFRDNEDAIQQMTASYRDEQSDLS